MRTDIYGQQIYNEMELCLLYLQDHNRTINRALVENQIKFDEVLQLENAPELVQYNKLDITVEQFDNQMQSNWLMPEQYKTMDNKIESQQIVEIIKEHKVRPNKDLILAMEFIKKDFDVTKENLIKMTSHLDKLELTYKTLVKEYQARNVVQK
jgi:hypothetical protein